eukprot:XP_016664655.1 PREDICTED: uncharacterized protein LOC107885509 [Acyrthosiphon pisum]
MLQVPTGGTPSKELRLPLRGTCSVAGRFLPAGTAPATTTAATTTAATTTTATTTTTAAKRVEAAGPWEKVRSQIPKYVNHHQKHKIVIGSAEIGRWEVVEAE